MKNFKGLPLSFLGPETLLGVGPLAEVDSQNFFQLIAQLKHQAYFNYALNTFSSFVKSYCPINKKIQR